MVVVGKFIVADDVLAEDVVVRDGVEVRPGFWLVLPVIAQVDLYWRLSPS